MSATILDLPPYILDFIFELTFPLATVPATCKQLKERFAVYVCQRVDRAIRIFNQTKFERHYEPMPFKAIAIHRLPSAVNFSNVLNETLRLDRKPLPSWCLRYLCKYCHYCKSENCATVNLSLRYNGEIFSSYVGKIDEKQLDWSSLVLFEDCLPYWPYGTPVCPRQLVGPESADVMIEFPKFGKKGVKLGDARHDRIWLKAPYFLPALHQFYQTEKGWDPSNFVQHMEDLINDEGFESEKNPVDSVNALYMVDLEREKFISFITETDTTVLLDWFVSILPRLRKRYHSSGIVEWLHGWKNLTNDLDINPFLDEISPH